MKKRFKSGYRKTKSFLRTKKIQAFILMDELISKVEVLFFHRMFPFSYARIQVKREGRGKGN